MVFTNFKVISETKKSFKGCFGNYIEDTITRVVEHEPLRLETTNRSDTHTVKYYASKYTNDLVNDNVITVYIDGSICLYFSYYYEEYDQNVEPKFEINEYTIDEIEEYIGFELDMVRDYLTGFP